MSHKYLDSLLQAECPLTTGQSVDCESFNTSRIKAEIAKTALKGGLIPSNARFHSNTLEQALSVDRRTSEFVSAMGGLFKGLCDVAPTAAYALEETKSCLRFPGMIGVGEVQLNEPGFAMKLNDSDFQLSAKGSTSEKYQRIAEMLQSHGGGLIVTHFNNTNGDAKASETLELISIAKTNLKNDFIVAHSGVNQTIGLEGIKQIGQYYFDNPRLPRNIWLDVSATIDGEIFEHGTEGCATKRKQYELAQAWRKFGLDRVIFGSDSGIGAKGLTDKKGVDRARQGLITNPFLTLDEKKKILFGNLEGLILKHAGAKSKAPIGKSLTSPKSS